MKDMKIKNILVCVVMLLLSVTASANDEFPNRKIYPGLNFIELDKFQAIYKDVIVVDVRSRYEYDTLHIKGALNYSRAELDFVDKMQTLRADNKAKKIVLYCNGRTCEQSYKAGRKCKEHDIQDILVYDGGVFEFATANPTLAILVGKEMGTADKLISKQKLDAHTVSYDKFVEVFNTRNSLVLDVRDKLQREGTALFFGKEKRAEIGDAERLDKYILEAKSANKTLLIYDNAGKQVRWLQYHLEDRGMKDYYFMQGGARKYFNDLRSAFAEKKQ